MTQSEIAKKLGVSQAAVSYVLRGGGKVSADLREKVLALSGGAVSQRGPGRPATADIGLFYSGPQTRPTPDLSRFIDTLGVFLQEELLKEGREFRHYMDMRLESLLGNPPKQLLEDVDARRISSIIAVNLHWNKACWSWLGRLGVPVVGFDHDFGWGALSFDFEKAGFDAAEILASKGCKKVEMLCSATREWVDGNVANKLNRPLRAGMANSLRRHGVKAPDCWLSPELLPEWLRDPHFSPSTDEMGCEMFKLLYRERKPDGVLVYTDVFAIGVQRALDELGLVVGKDIELVLLSNKEFSFPGNERFINLRLSLRKMAASFLSLAQSAERGERPREIYLNFEMDGNSNGGAAS